MRKRDSSAQALWTIAPRFNAPQAGRPGTPQLSQKPQPTGHEHVIHDSSEAHSPCIVESSMEDDESAGWFAPYGQDEPGSRGTLQSNLCWGTSWGSGNTSWNTSSMKSHKSDPWDTSWGFGDTLGNRSTMRSDKSNLSGSTLLDEPESGPPISEDPARLPGWKLSLELKEYARKSDHDAHSLAPETRSKAFGDETGTLTRLTPFYGEPWLLESTWGPDGWSGPALDAINTIPKSRQTESCPPASGPAVQPRFDDAPRKGSCSPSPTPVVLYHPDELIDLKVRGREHPADAELSEQALQIADDCGKVDPVHVQQMRYTLTDMLLGTEVTASSGDLDSCGDSEDQSDTDQSLPNLTSSERVESPSVRLDVSLNDTEASLAFPGPILEPGLGRVFARRGGRDEPEDQQGESDGAAQPPNNKKRRNPSDATENDKSSKRRRQNGQRYDGNDSDKDDDADDNEDPGHCPSQSGRRSTPSRGRPFACPCWKRDPLEFTRCHEWKTMDIDSVRRVSLPFAKLAPILTQQ